MSPPPTARDVIRDALTASSTEQRAQSSVYLNATTPGAQPGLWLSDVGFYSVYGFTYARCHASYLTPPESPGERELSRVVLLGYGATSDHRRLSSRRGQDRIIQATRGDDRRGVAAYPGQTDHLGAAYLRDTTATPRKTQAVLAGMSGPGDHPAFHVVISREGSVYVCAPLDHAVTPVADTENALCVGLESALWAPRQDRSRIEEAPMTDAQMRSLAVLLAKVHSARSSLPVVFGESFTYGFREEDRVPSTVRTWWSQETNQRTLEALIQAEGAYDPVTEVWRAEPPRASRRGAAQVAIGTTDTMGATSMLLGAYADLAAQDRAESMATASRRRVFIQRAQVAHTSGDEASIAAGAADASSAFEPIVPSVGGTGPHVYDYSTGHWGDGGVV